MNEYIAVGPTLQNPLLAVSLLMSSAFGVLTGTWWEYRNWLMVDKVRGVFNKRAKLIYELQHQQQAASLQQFGGHGLGQSSTILYRAQSFLYHELLTKVAKKKGVEY
jgi:hypothetical protein